MNEGYIIEPEEENKKRPFMGSLETAVNKEFIDVSEIRDKAQVFFGDFPGMSISQNEIFDFAVFSIHSLKRVLNAMHQKENNREFENNSNQSPAIKRINSLVYHDISHVVGVIATGKNVLNQNSIVPPFLKLDNEVAINNCEVFENELYGFLFGQIPINKNHQNFTRWLLDQSKALEEVFPEFLEAYLENCMKATFDSNQKMIVDLNLPNQELLLEEAKRLTESIQRNPPKKLVEMLRYIWENQDDPNVLVNLFFSVTREYIENLKKRNEYKELAKNFVTN